MAHLDGCHSVDGGPTLAIMVRSRSRSRSRLDVRARLLAALGLVALIGGGVQTPVVRAASVAQPAGALGSSTVSTERLGGADRYAVAVAVSQRLYPHGGAPVVYLTEGQNYADALAAGPIAARDGGAILYTDNSSLPEAVGQELVRLAPARVEVMGGTSVIDAAVVDQVTALLAPETVVERIAGTDAAGTAAALSARSFEPRAAATVFVAAAESFPDAIAAGPAAAQLGGPLLLVAGGSLPAATADELRRLEPDRVVIVGTAASVSESVLDAIDLIVPEVERVSGVDAYAAASAVAARFLPHATTEVVASGPGFANGLVAVPLAAARQAPILFVGPDDLLPKATRDRLVAARPTRIVIAGSVSEVVRAQMVGFSDGRLAVPPATPAYPAYDSGYHDPGEMITLLRATEIAYPSLVHIFSIGKSYEGRDIWAAKISDNVSVDEDEPEVLVDALHHADEHLGVEQALYLLATLTSDYTTDPYVNHLVNEREIWIVFALNPDGWAYDLYGGKYHFWRKNRQPNPGWPNPGTDLNRNYSYKWACCNGSSAKPYAWNYRGSAAFSTPEAKALRNLVNSRVVDGKQQIRTHVTLHTNGQLILYPYGYTRTTLPSDMTADDHAVFVAMAQAMARLNGYTYRQSSGLYITDGDEIDWLYYQYRIFSFTWELYPTEQASLTADVYPPFSVVATQTARNRGALLYLIEAAACPYAAINKAAQYCSGGSDLPAPSGLLP
jgi:putative cell wall-binding protein